MKFSRLTLGTVQFGLNYGIANLEGQPSYEKVCDIIKTAYKAGVNCLDTAAAYGSSEEVIGKALQDLNLHGKILIISKITSLNNIRPGSAEKNIFDSINNSLHKLGVSILDGCLLHREADLKYAPFLLKARDHGLIKMAGVSIDSDKYLKEILHSGLDAIQLPFNIFDKRFTSYNFLTEAKKQEMHIFARSIYLQGLLLLPEDKISSSLIEIVPVRRQLEKLASDFSMSPSELFVRFVLSFSEIDSIVSGVDNPRQLQENIALSAKGSLDTQLIAEINKIVPAFKERIIRPSMWSQ